MKELIARPDYTRRSIIQSLNALQRMKVVERVQDETRPPVFRWRAIRTVLYENPTGQTIVVG